MGVPRICPFDAARQLVKSTTTKQAGKKKSPAAETTTNTWDRAGNLVESTTALAGGKTSRVGYAYDPTGQLTAYGPTVTAGAPGAEPAGLADKTTVRRAFDALGRVVTESYRSSLCGKADLTWAHDGLDPVAVTGKRAKDAGLFLRDATGQLLGEQTGKKNTIAWHVADALQSLHATTTAGQLSKKTNSYTDYGAETADTGRQFGYSGERRDPKGAGLVNYYARPYDPKTATWLQPDRYRGSLPNPATLNRTGFVVGNPVTLKDNRGYCPICIGLVIGLIIAGGIPTTAWAPTTDPNEMAQAKAQDERDSNPRNKIDALTDLLPGVYAVKCLVGFRINCPAGQVALSAAPGGMVGKAGVTAGAKAASQAPAAYRWLRGVRGAKAATGLSDDAIEVAYQGMRSDGGHATRHLRADGLIANRGSLASQVAEFQQLTSPILRSPAKTFDWKLGRTMTRAYAGQAGGRTVVVFVAQDGGYEGSIVSAVVPDAAQMAQWGLT